MRDTAEFSGHFGAPTNAEKHKSGKKTSVALAKFLLFTVILASLAGSVFYIYTSKPEMVRELLLKVDRFGLTPVGQKEQQRLAAINNLPITYAEKQVLIKRTVFLGATTEMVILALGQPKTQRYLPPSGNQPSSTSYIYHFTKDSQPTLLLFNNNQLAKAEKTSNIDITSK